MERYTDEARRGYTPRYWEDVTVGETLPPLLKGPYTVTTAIAFEQAWGGLFIRAHGLWYAYLQTDRPVSLTRCTQKGVWSTALAGLRRIRSKRCRSMLPHHSRRDDDAVLSCQPRGMG